MNTVFSRKMVTGLTTLLMVLLIPNISQAQFNSAPAFPGAEGYGRYTTGGRGGTVYHVTTLEDYCDNTDYSSTQTKDSEISGSLRSAVKKSGARIIVFDVAGTIELKAPLKIANDNITILGQTAPGNGICLKNYTVSINANNVIIRYIRCRLGSDGRRYYSSGDALSGSDQIVEDDAMNAYHKTGSEVSNIIIDHCSISWSVDECGSFYGNKDFTLQWCMLTESLKNAGHTKGAHGYGGIWGGERASFHHNLIADHDSRNPRFDHGYVSTLAGPVDYTNNVLYNWGGNSAYGGENKSGETSKKFNMINNYYRYGGATSDKDRLLNPTTYCSNCNSSNAAGVVPGTFYISGNYMYGSSTVTNDNTCSSAIVMDSKGLSYSNWLSGYVSSTKFQATTQDFGSYNNISIQSAETSYNKVLDYAGASYSRDATDTRVCNDAKNGTTSYTTGAAGSNGATGGLIDQPTDVGGYPTLTGTKATDTDNDGIPDEWETKYGLDNSTDNSATYTLDSKGYYTDLEVYANSLVEKITKAERADATETFEEYYPTLTSSSSSTETTLFSLTSTATSNVSVASGVDQDLASYATITGGSALVHNGHASSAANMISSNGIYLGNSGGSYVKLTLTNAIQTGDVLTTTGSDGGFVATGSSTNSSDNISGKTFTFTSDFAGKTDIYICRGASKPTISGITITRQEAEKYTITAYATKGSVTITNGSTTIASGSEVDDQTSLTLTATANSGYEFSQWSDGNTDNPRTVTVSGADVSLTARFVNKYTLSASTSTTESGATTYTFNNGFSITNESEKGYASANDYIKYSAIQYTINLPAGVAVTKVAFTGYDNYDTTDSYIKELNGTSSSDYVFPAKGTNGTTVKTHTITLSEVAVGSLTFTVGGKQCCFCIDIYGYDPYTVKIPSSGLASFSCPEKVDIANATSTDADGLKAYYGSSKNSTTLKLTKIEKVPANEGIILSGTAGASYAIPIYAGETEAIDNILLGTSNGTFTVTSSLPDTYYGFNGGEFKRVDASANDVTIPSYKAYLKVSNSSDAKFAFVFEDDEATGIKYIRTQNDDAIYNLSGQRVDKTYRGIIIKNGVKIFKK